MFNTDFHVGIVSDSYLMFSQRITRQGEASVTMLQIIAVTPITIALFKREPLK